MSQGAPWPRWQIRLLAAALGALCSAGAGLVLRTHSTAVFISYRLIVGGLILFALLNGYISAAVG